jgi:glycosyltransferase involved in cell wall biosynthesis
MLHSSSLSILIPALNEELNLEAAVINAMNTTPSFFKDFEIIIFNDGSHDNTGKIADRLAVQWPNIIRVVHHKKPNNLGGCYKEGIRLATKDYIIMIPGDNECGQDVLKKVLSGAGQADIIIPYTANPEVRPWQRRIISKGFTQLINFTSKCKLKYYNGTVLHKSHLIKNIEIETNSFGYQAEALIKLIRSGVSYKEVPIQIHHRTLGKSKAFKLNNMIETLRFLTRSYN